MSDKKGKKDKDSDKFKIVTPVFRASYVNLANARRVEDGEPYYGLMIVLPKEDPFWAEVDNLTELAAKEFFNGEVPDNLSTTRKDGDLKKKNPEWKGCFAQPANTKASNGKPGVVDANLQPILDPEELYSGAYYRATVRVAAYKYGSVKKGVSLFLQNVMKVKDGEPFTSRATAEDDFAEFLAEEGVNPLD